MGLQIITFLAIIAVTADIGEAAKPCRANRPTTPQPTDSSRPCMAVWENMKSDDSAFADYALATTTAATAAECGKTCESEIKCAYAFFKTNQCMTFERFIPSDFAKNGDMSLVFKLYLNGTTTCATATIDGLASSKERMYYPDGGSYWLFNNIMDTIGYANNNPALGYKRRKRSILGWLLNF